MSSVQNIKVGTKVMLKSKSIGNMTLDEFINDDCNAATSYRKNGYIKVCRIHGDYITVGDHISCINVSYNDINIVE